MDQLSAVALKNLGDKIPDKRKQAATEVENVVRGMKQRGDVLAIKALVESLHQRYINNSMQPNMRKGGCLAMASVAVVMLKVVFLLLVTHTHTLTHSYSYACAV